MILDRIDNFAAARRRRFRVVDDIDAILAPGALVCLRDDRGDLLIATNNQNKWDLSSRSHRGAFNSIPPEALFVVLRRGTHVGFQCLGAEGRLIQASEQSGGGHTLCHGFGSREAWEMSSNGSLVNAHYRFKHLGARVHPVSALRTIDLAHWEEDTEIRVADALSKLESQLSNAASSERRAADLIKASQRAAADNQKDLQNIRDKLEVANRMALHWQEQAALAQETLKQTQLNLAALGRSSSMKSTNGSNKSSAPSTGNNEIVEQLRAQIAALKMEHHGQVRELEARHAALLAQAQNSVCNVANNNGASSQAAVEAVRAEAAAALAAMQANHAAEIEQLLEEKSRLDSALRCIKDMMQGQWGVLSPNGEKNGSDGELGINTTANGAIETPGANEHSSGEEDTFEGPAVGIPVDPLATPLTAGAHHHRQAYNGAAMRPNSAFSGGHAASLNNFTISPAPADYAVFDAAGNRSKVNDMYDLVNAFQRPGSGYSSVATESHQQQQQQNQEVYHFSVNDAQNLKNFGSNDSNSTQLGASPPSRNRVAVGNGNCYVVDYKGQRPEVVNEASMQRILDPPAALGMSGEGPLVRLATGDSMAFEDHRQNVLVDDNSPVAALQDQTPLKNLSSATNRSCNHPASTSAPASASKSEALGGPGDSPWNAGSLSLPGSRTGTPLVDRSRPPPRFSLEQAIEEGQEENSPSPLEIHVQRSPLKYENFEGLAPTAAVQALETRSPSAAQFLTQYMADQVSIRASMPNLYGKSKPKAKNNGQAGNKSPSKSGKIPAIRKSAPSVLKRSSFLQRPLLSDNEIFWN